jgi:hypothetical protein
MIIAIIILLFVCAVQVYAYLDGFTSGTMMTSIVCILIAVASACADK